MATIIGAIPPDVLKARLLASRLDKPEVIREIRKFGKIKREKLVAQKREERRVMQGKFNAIRMKSEG